MAPSPAPQLHDIERRLDAGEPVSLPDLRAWLDAQPLHDQGRARRLLTREQTRYVRLAIEAERPALEAGREPLASEAREAQRHLANAGEIARLLQDLEARGQAAAGHRTRLAGGGAPPAAEAHAEAFPSLREYRAMSIGQDPSGGYLVDAGVAAVFFDRMRAASIVLGLPGLRAVTVTSDRLKLPRIRTSTTAAAIGERGEITASDLGLGVVELPARKYAVRTIASQELLADSNPAARELIRLDHELQLAAALDRDMLEGNGSTALLGLRHWPGVTTTELGAGNGDTPTLANILDGIYRLEAKNGTPTAIVMHPRTWNTIRKIEDQQDRLQLQPDPTSEAARRLFGIPVFLSSQITITEVVGGSSDCSWIGIVDGAHLVAGAREGLRALYDEFTRSSTDEVVIQSISRWVFGVVNEDAVQIITGVRP